MFYSEIKRFEAMRVIHVVFPVFLAYYGLIWMNRPPKFDWTPQQPIQNYPVCPKHTSEIHVVFGGSSLLGKYIAKTWKREYPNVCLINYARTSCPGCDLNILGDVRDTQHINRMFRHYNSEGNPKQTITSVLFSIKPSLTGTDWRTFMEVNFSALAEVTKIAKQTGVKHLLYVSSIAAASHFKSNHLVTESDPQPLYTDYQAPYDLSKRLAEDFILHQNDEESFRTVALRVSGILGGVGDPFFHHRMFPFLFTFNSPIIVDYGYAGNIADALAEMLRVVARGKKSAVSGQFYYFTGEHIPESKATEKMNELTGKPLLTIPYDLLNLFLDFWQWFRWDHNTYTLIDLMRCANVEQTFDNSKFHATFPDFKVKYTVLEALEHIYGSNP